jgi:hypothetical protein
MPHARRAQPNTIAEVLDLIEDLVTQTFASWNLVRDFLRQLDALKRAA